MQSARATALISKIVIIRIIFKRFYIKQPYSIIKKISF